MALAENLLLYALQGGVVPALMAGLAVLAIALVLMKSLQLWLLLRSHDEQMETLEAIAHVPSPTFRLQLLRQLRMRMSGLEGRLLDIVLTTPIGGVRSEKLASELAHCRGRLEFWFAVIARLALAAPTIGFAAMVFHVTGGGTPSDVVPGMAHAAVLPLLFGTVTALPAMLLLFIADHYWLSSLTQVNKHSTQLSQLPTGFQHGMT